VLDYILTTTRITIVAYHRLHHDDKSMGISPYIPLAIIKIKEGKRRKKK
jgi:hypothetical protein